MEGHSRVRNANAEHRESLTNLERLALFVTTKIGSMKFFFLLLTITIIFVLWLFCSNILQLLLMPLILIGQNLQGRHSEVRAESDFDLNVRAEKEIKRILAHLENQDKMSIETLRRIDELHRR